MTRCAKNHTIERHGSERKFLQDGDTVVMKAFCKKGDMRIGFGEVYGKIVAAS